MHDGQIILDRWMEHIVAECAQELGASHTAHSGGWVHQLQRGHARSSIFGYKFSLNNAAAAAIAGDKVATYELLRAADVPATPHYLIRRTIHGDYAWHGEPHGQLVLKPLGGTSGHDVKKFVDRTTADAWLTSQTAPAWAASPYVDIAIETRLIMLDGRVLLAYDKQAREVDGLKMFNLGQGATAHDMAPSNDQVELARGAMHALDLRLGAVDLIETARGERFVLEINDGIMMENYMRQSPDNRQKARDVYRAIVTAMLS